MRSAWYGEGAPDKGSLDACVTARTTLSKLSRERVRQEMLKLVVAPKAVPTLSLMQECKVLAVILAGRIDIGRLEALSATEAAQELVPDPVRRLRALSADQTAQDLRRAFVLSNEETKRLEALAQLPPVSPAFRHAERQTLLYWHGRQAVIDRLLLDWSAGEHPSDDADYAALLGEAQVWQKPKLPIGGKDLQAAGIAEGKELGHLLQALEDWWVAGGFTANKAELMARLAAIR
ncbi:MAG: hypothetical protein AAGF81_20055 [Pseudomonadota bacterium]